MTKWNGIPIAICCLVLLSGCAGDKTDPADDGGTNSGSPSGTSAEVPTPGEDNGETGPEGNSEPPLTAVTDAVSSVPAVDTGADPVEANTGGVELKVVTPDEFDAVIESHRGKVVMVDFWATWCVPCRKAFPKTVELAKQHAEDGLVVITMSFDDAEVKEDVIEFLTDNKSTGQNLMCSFGGADESFSSYDIGEAGLPYYRVYDRDGSLTKAFKNDPDAGIGVDEAEVHKLVEELLAKGE